MKRCNTNDYFAISYILCCIIISVQFVLYALYSVCQHIFCILISLGGDFVTSAKEKIKALCNINNTSFAKLEEELGFAKGYLSKIDKLKPSSETMHKLAKTFYVGSDYLITDTTIGICPICKFPYDPLSEPCVELHKKRHDTYIEACKNFGKIHDYTETLTVPKHIKHIFTDLAYHEYSEEEFLEIVDERLDYEFSDFIWFEVSSYGFSNDIDKRKYRWEWKRFYIEENIKPNEDISLKVCNIIRQKYEVRELTPEEVLQESKDFMYKLYFKVIAEDKAEHFFKMFINLPPERRQNVYDQIDLQTRQMEREKGGSV